MKVMIDISKEVYKGLVDDTHIFVKSIFDAIKNGIPLEQIRDEIDEEYRDESEHPYGQGLRRALQIIDKYRGKE